MSELYGISGCGSDDRVADVVFIHGVNGDPFETWRHGGDAASTWPHWLGEAFPDVGVWSLGHAASISMWQRLLRWLPGGTRDSGYGMAFPDRARQALDRMVQRDIGQRPLVLVGHSLGGIIAKQILRIAADAIDDPGKHAVFERTRGVMFLATPHGGSEIASLIAALRVVVGPTPTAKMMQLSDPYLADLHDWFRARVQEPAVRTVTYFEGRGVAGAVTVVNRISAHPGVGAAPVALDEDHISISKPRARDAQVCIALERLLREHVLAPPSAAIVAPGLRAPESPAPGDGPTPRAPGPPLELPPGAAAFFGREAERARVEARLREGRDTAIVGPPGMGKTALAAEAVRSVVGASGERLPASPFPGGVVFLDLYKYHGAAEPAWHALANSCAGVSFLDRATAQVRATEACRPRRLLVIVEGAEEADGADGRTSLPELLSVLSPQCRRLVLTRSSTQVAPAEAVRLDDALEPADAAALLDELTGDMLASEDRVAVLELLAGHPLALTWAGNLLARGDESPGYLVREWRAGGLPPLTDPQNAGRTLEWLFARSTRALDEPARLCLHAAGLLGPAPFPIGAMDAALAGGPAPAGGRGGRCGNWCSWG